MTEIKKVSKANGSPSNPANMSSVDLVRDGFELDSGGNPETANSSMIQRKELSELLRIATVDNFQGEEAQVIIVSLVRSNNQRKVGFLKTTNRINVLLSRAQHGMYLIGNSETYSNVPMWEKVLGMLRADNAVGDSIELLCPRHPDMCPQIREPEDFDLLSPEGGCRLPCDKRLDCGHRKSCSFYPPPHSSSASLPY